MNEWKKQWFHDRLMMVMMIRFIHKKILYFIRIIQSKCFFSGDNIHHYYQGYFIEIWSMEKQYDDEMKKKSGKQWKTTPKIIDKKFFIRTYIWYLILAIRIHRKKNEIESLSGKRLRNLIPKNFSERMKNWWCYLPIPHTHTHN